MEDKKTVIDFPISGLYDITCSIEITTSFKGGMPSEYSLQHDRMVERVAKCVLEKTTIKNIKIKDLK